MKDNALEKSTFYTQKFESVQSLRGIAAFFVVLQHVCFLQRGSFGVDIFFIISGFIMMYVTEHNTNHFLLKRAIRILPLYYLMTIVAFLAVLIAPQLFSETTASAESLIKSLLFIPFQMGEATQPLLRVGWTVNYEVLFYLIFFLSMTISKKYRALIASVILILLEVTGKIARVTNEPFVFWTDSIILEFAIGMWLFYVTRWIYERVESSRNRQILKRTEKAERAEKKESTEKAEHCGGMPAASRKNKYYITIILTILCAAIFAYEWWSYENPAVCSLPELIRWGLPSAILFLAFFLMGLYVKLPKLLVRLGDISFSLYLIHYYPMRLMNKLMENTVNAGVTEICMMVACLIVTIAAAWVCYQLVEVRFTNALKKKLLYRSK